MKIFNFQFSIFNLGLIPCVMLAFATVTKGAAQDVSAFARLPVLEGGRVMPMDTYARLRLLQLSGRSTFDKKPAVEWLARLLFTPQLSHEQPVLLVNHPEVLEAMGVEVG